MESVEEYRKAIKIQRASSDALYKLTNDLSSITKIRENIKAEVTSYFEDIINAINKRKASLFQQIDDKLNTLHVELKHAEQSITTNAQTCAEMISAATKMYSINPSAAKEMLQILRSVGLENKMLPSFKFEVSPKLKENIEAEGAISIATITTPHPPQEIEVPKVTLAGSTTQSFADGTGNSALFYYPTGVALNPRDGYLYISDMSNHRIRKISPTKEVTTFVGSGIVGFQDGVPTKAQFNSLTYIAYYHRTGDMYVADYSNNKIRKVSVEGVVTTLVGGAAGSTDGPVSTATLQRPWGIAVDQKDGTIYFSDQHKIRKISPQGIVSTVAGSGSGTFADGVGALASFCNPYGIDIHPTTGDIYVADYTNRRIRQITSGVVTTIAGTGTAGSQDGNCQNATFSYPIYVKINLKDDSLLVADKNNSKIRKIHQGVVSTLSWPNFTFTNPRSLFIDASKQVCYISDCHSVKQVPL